MELIFTDKIYLWFLLSLPILLMAHFWTLKHTRKKALRFANYEAIEHVTGGKVLPRNYGLLVIRLFIVVLVILAISGPVLYYQGEASDFDFVLTIDSSGSMLADDYQPNRLEAAKNAALLFINSLKGNARIGIVSFSGVSIVKQELNDDLDNAKDVIKSLEVETAGGTAIGEAIITSSNLLLAGTRSKIIILLTDGQNNIGISPAEALKSISKEKVVIHTIGIGTEQGGKFLKELNVFSSLDEDTLKYISETTQGSYHKAINNEELKEVFKNLATTKETKLSFNMSFLLILIGLFLLFGEWTLSNTKYRILP
jgi:Ca-activated chloride channel family protein